MIRFRPETREISLSVRDLIYLDEEPAFGPEATALRARAGSKAHRRHQEEAASAVEPSRYEAERPVEFRCERRGYRILVQGRIDGLRREEERWVVEEIKTVIIEAGRFDPGEIARAVIEDGAFADYRLQLELYVLIFGASIGASSEAALPVSGRLILRNLAGDGSQAAVDLSPDLPGLRIWMEGRLDLVIDRLEAEEAAREVRRAAAGRIAFPFPRLRRHQGELIEEVRTALERGEQLLACAPTGVGKTAAVLCAALRHSLETGRRIFYATSRTTQRRIVAETLERIAAASVGQASMGGSSAGTTAPPFRAVVLRAREKICPNLEEAGFIRCHEDFCRYARDYAAKVESGGVLGALLASPVVTPDAAAAAGKLAVACPFELSLDAALEADIVVGDYNHIFDPESGLTRLFRGRRSRPEILIIDEAHCLPSRGRESFSPSIARAEAAALGKWAREQMGEAECWRVLSPPTAGALREWCRELEKLLATLSARGREELGDPPVYRVEIDPAVLRRLSDELEAVRTRALIDRKSAAVERPSGPAPSREAPADPIERFAGHWNRFKSAVELLEGSPSLLLFDKSDSGGHKLRLLCLDPATPLGRRIEKFHSVIALSATMEPLEFYRDALGLRPDRARAVRLPSPFPPENRKVLVYDRISTYYRSRSRDAAAVALLIEEIAAAERGNYLVCFSSYAYLREVRVHISDRARCVEQTPGLSETERDGVLGLLREPGSARTLLAVQGGIFTEGVDYPGAMLIGVIVVGPGLPAVDFDMESIRAHFEDRFEQGFEYAYLYPAMNRVIQCAGRVIRSETDAGAIVLVGERFSQSQYARLFPPDWYRNSPRELISTDPVADLKEFWEGIRARRGAGAKS